MHCVNFIALLKMDTAMERTVDASFTCDNAAVLGDRKKGTFLIGLLYCCIILETSIT